MYITTPGAVVRYLLVAAPVLSRAAAVCASVAVSLLNFQALGKGPRRSLGLEGDSGGVDLPPSRAGA